MPLETQLGIVDEVTYGTPVTVTKFMEFSKESLAMEMGTAESSAPLLRAGQGRVQRIDRKQPFRKGVKGTIELPMLSKGHGLWLKHAFGAVSTGAIVDSNYTHTFTIGDLLGKFFTAQLNRPFHPSGTAQAFTHHGCKITKATWSMEVGGVLTAVYEIDGEDEDTSTALATASYPAAGDLFSWAGSSATIAGAAVEVTKWEVSITNPLDVERTFLRGSTLKKEPVENGLREIAWSFEGDFVDLTQRNRFTGATNVSKQAAIVITNNAPTILAGATLPQFAISMPFCWFDEGSVNIDGPDPLKIALSGMALNGTGGTNDAISATYRTTDATP